MLLSLAISMAEKSIPGVQKPHWRPWFFLKDFCMACKFSFVPKPSTVKTFLLLHCTAKTEQDFTHLSSKKIIQEPHWVVSHPT